MPEPEPEAQLSIDEAAALSGKSARQIRYLIQKGELAHKREGRRIVIPRSAITPTPAQAQQAERRLQGFKAAVESTLGTGGERPRYSVVELKAWQVGAPLYQGLLGRLGAEAPPVAGLHEMLRLLGQGCHRFEAEDKLAAYRLARDRASAAATELHLSDEGAAAAVIEQELLPAITGLLRRLDRGKGRRW